MPHQAVIAYQLKIICSTQSIISVSLVPSMKRLLLNKHSAAANPKLIISNPKFRQIIIMLDLLLCHPHQMVRQIVSLTVTACNNHLHNLISLNRLRRLFNNVTHSLQLSSHKKKLMSIMGHSLWLRRDKSGKLAIASAIRIGA
jgi:hypothetical protein